MNTKQYSTDFSRFIYVQAGSKPLRPLVRSEGQMISLSILYQIEARKKLHQWVQLNQILPITLLKDLTLYQGRSEVPKAGGA